MVRGWDNTQKRRVEAKFVEGGVRGAVRELAPAECLVSKEGDTLRVLKEKHPSASDNIGLSNPPDGPVVPAVATEENIRKEILSFHDGHLRSLVAHGSAEAGSTILSALIDLANFMLRGEILQFAVPILYAADECGTKKKMGAFGICCWEPGFKKTMFFSTTKNNK